MVMLQFLLFFFCAFFVSIFASKCSEKNSVEWKNKCYFFVNKLDVFCDAEINCMNNFDGHLTSIEEGFTNTFVAQIGEPRINASLDIWIGANNLVNMDVWQWTDGSFFNYSNWQTLNISSVSQRCGALSFNNGIWNVEDCYKLKPYVCATNAAGAVTPTPLPLPTTLPPFPWTTTTTLSTTHIPTTSDIETTTGSSHPTSQTSNTATNPPTSETLIPGSPTTEIPSTSGTSESTTEGSSTPHYTVTTTTVTTPPTSESTPATSILTSKNPTTFETTINTFSPTSESPISSSQTTEVPTTPSTEMTSSNPTSPTRPPTLEPFTTNSPTSVATTQSTTSEITLCPVGWKHFDSFCYSLTSEIQNWYDAKAECVTKGGILTSIHSQSELDFIDELLEKDKKWIGLYITPNRETFAWIDNTTYDFNSSNNLSVDNEKCVYALYEFNNDLDCDEEKLIGVCKKLSSQLPSTIPPTIEPEPSTISSDTPTTPEITSSISYPSMYCPSDWSLYEPSSSCYSQTPNKMTWLASEQYCVEQGGHLASIHSEKELNFTDELVPHYKWIGFNFIDETWKWTDGSLVDFAEWYENYPKKNFNKCVNSLNGFINDYGCDNFTLIGLCKKPSNQISSATFLPTTHEIQTSPIPTTLEPSTSESTIQIQTTTFFSTTNEPEPSTIQTTNTPTPETNHIPDFISYN